MTTLITAAKETNDYLEMTAASWRFRSVCEEDLDKVLKD